MQRDGGVVLGLLPLVLGEVALVLRLLPLVFRELALVFLLCQPLLFSLVGLLRKTLLFGLVGFLRKPLLFGLVCLLRKTLLFGLVCLLRETLLLRRAGGALGLRARAGVLPGVRAALRNAPIYNEGKFFAAHPHVLTSASKCVTIFVA